MRGLGREAAMSALTRLGIAHLAARPYTMISGGERQFVLLARALAQDPQFIVLDEPTASLDFGNQGKLMDEIVRLGASTRCARRRARGTHARQSRSYLSRAGARAHGRHRRHQRIPAGLGLHARKDLFTRVRNVDRQASR